MDVHRPSLSGFFLTVGRNNNRVTKRQEDDKNSTLLGIKIVLSWDLNTQFPGTHSFKSICQSFHLQKKENKLYAWHYVTIHKSNAGDLIFSKMIQIEIITWNVTQPQFLPNVPTVDGMERVLLEFPRLGDLSTTFICVHLNFQKWWQLEEEKNPRSTHWLVIKIWIWSWTIYILQQAPLTRKMNWSARAPSAHN